MKWMMQCSKDAHYKLDLCDEEKVVVLAELIKRLMGHPEDYMK